MDDITTGQVNRKLSGINLLCMAFVICNSWAGIAGSLQLALIAGGPATLVYSILVTTTAYLSIAASMAELAAVYPTAGGQYHFTSILAPEKFRRGLSYTCALLAVFSWLAIGVSVTSIAAQQLLAVISAGMLNFAPQPWHVFLVYQGFSLLAILYNALALKRSPWTHNLACYWIPFVVMEQGFRSHTIAIIITCFATAMALTIIIATQEASSRLVWAFARDNGLLFSHHLQKIQPHLDVPLWSLFFVWLLTSLCAFLYLASKTDYTSVILAFSFLFGLANWLLHAKNHYGGPVIETWEGHDPGTTTAISVSSQNDDLCKNMV
ncbi:hypothetical protein BDV24DRAFT_155792 [Aspergillus arachidicola]|uniref:Choline transport protein n=1 Tax=Aspergillus arachidicola TaxID=656916 RepID=A0A5N6XRA5_9EURO|nr:hypothetical protein BDV24DRAFT_155792 [Aspergillus arachidicola]